jgi:hypothetical protein
MKIFFGSLFIFLIISNNVLADVYYCTDKDAIGFEGLNENRKSTKYITKKFKAKINFDQPSFQSSELNFASANPMNCRKASDHMQCASYLGEIISFDLSAKNLNFFNYQRAVTFGRDDDILIAYGTCEKF